MTNILSLVLLLTLTFTSVASAQTVREISDTTLFTIRQESIPPAPDSGGKWFPLTIVVTNNSAYPVHLPGFQTHYRYGGNQGCPPAYAVLIADSAWTYADSILIDEDVLVGHMLMSDYAVAHGTPLKYKDSVLALWRTAVDTAGQSYVTIDGRAYHGRAFLEFVVPPHGTLRVPFLIQSIGSANSGPLDIAFVIFDIQQRSGVEYWFSDSAGIRRMGDTGEYQSRPFPFWLSITVP